MQPIVLVIEDDATNLEVIVDVLTHAGLKTITARNGTMGLKRAAMVQPDLILLDVMLPDLNGFDICRRLKAAEATRSIPVIFLTVLDSIEDKLVGFDAGGVDYLTKPLHQKEVLARVQTHLKLRQLQNHLEQVVTQRTAELQLANAQLQQTIEEQRKTEAALRVSEQQYHLLAEHVADGIAILDQGRIIFANQALGVLLGYPSAELTGQSAHAIFFCDEQAAHDEQFDRLMRRDIDTFSWQEQCTPRNGSPRWMEILHTRITWQNQPAVLLTIRDITAVKQREFAMQAERNHLQQENLALKASLNDRYKFGGLIGKSPVMQAVYLSIVNAAATEAHIVIYGESGTGKELVARTIHERSGRRDKAFIPVNCSTIPENLFESEFFGYRKGAFTGAYRDKPGIFDVADGGTVFLDEVGELPLAIQAKLLRVIEGGGYSPIGSQSVKHSNLRLIVAGSQNLTNLVRQGKIREDFFYRVHVLEISLPPLRERIEDLPLLVDYFLRRYGDLRTYASLPEEVNAALCDYHWPGNVRELQNELQRYLAEQRLKFLGNLQGEPAQPRSMPDMAQNPAQQNLAEALADFENQCITRALHEHSGNIAAAAEALGIPPRTLYRRLQKYKGHDRE